MRAMVFANRAMATRANLEREARNWIDAEGTTPPGNGALSFCCLKLGGPRQSQGCQVLAITGCCPSSEY